MTMPPALFDTALLPLRRKRALDLGFREGADFLHRIVRDVLAERLADVTRRFPRALVAGALDAGLPEAINPQAGGEEMRLLDPAGLGEAAAIRDEVLDVPTGHFDLVVSSLLMHWLNDPVGHLVQLRHALKPDGLAIAALFGGQTLNELRTALAEAEAEVEGGLSPRIAPMGELRDLGGLIQRAGLTMPVADSERMVASYESPLHLMRDLRAMGETSILTGRRKGFMRRETLMRACEIYHHAFPAEGGRIRATFEIVFLTGWSPGPDQPQPLRPGSAKTRLADALGTFEIPAGEKTPK